MLHKKQNYLLLISSVALVVVIFLITNNSSSTTSATIPTVLSISKTPLSAPLYVALEKGFFQKCGLDIVVDEVIGGKRSFNSMISRQADVGTTSDSVISFNSFSHQDFKVAFSFASSGNDVKIVYRNDINPTKDTFARIGYYPGTASQYLLDLYLSLTGYMPDAQFIELPPELLLDALLNKEIDMMANWEPYPWKAINEQGDELSIADSKHISSLHFDLVFNDDYIRSHPTGVSKLEDALTLAILFMTDNPEETKEIIISRLQLDRGFIDWIWDDYVFSINPASNLLFSYAANARWLITEGIIKDQPLTDFSNIVLPQQISTSVLDENDINKRCSFK